MIAKVVVFGPPDIVSCRYVSSQCAYSLKQSDPLHIDGYFVALLVATPDADASSSRTEFDCPNPTIKCFEDVFGCITIAFK